MHRAVRLGLVSAAALLLVNFGVVAQTPPPGNDPQATIDALQRQIDELKRQQQGATPPAPALPAGCFLGGDGKNYCGGWIVEVRDGTDQSAADMSLVGRFVADKFSRLGMHDHAATMSFRSERMGYLGSALFNVTRPGVWSFTVEAEYPRHEFLMATPCTVTMTLDDDPLLKFGFRTGDRHSAAKSLQLAAGLWTLGFDWRCEFNWYSVKPEVAPPRLVFKVLPPGEFQPRLFRADELLHVRG